MDKSTRHLSTSEILAMMWRVTLEHPNATYEKLIVLFETKLERKITSQEKTQLFNLYTDPDFYTQVFDGHSIGY